jgi:hypothetical protein
MFISVPDRIRIRPKISDPYGSGIRIRNTDYFTELFGSGTFSWKPKRQKKTKYTFYLKAIPVPMSVNP